MTVKLVDKKLTRPVQVVEEAPPNVEQASEVHALLPAPKRLEDHSHSAPQRNTWIAPVAWTLVLAAAGVGAYFGYKPLLAWWTATHSAKPTTSGPKPVSVVTAPVTSGKMDLFINGLGSATASNTVTVRSRVEGEVVNVAFKEDEPVKQGQLLAEIDPRPFEVQLTDAEGQLAKDQAALDIAQTDLDRYKTLIASKTINQQQIDAQVALVKQAEAAVKIDQGKIANARLQLSYCRIVSPLDGRIGFRNVDLGNMVRANDPTGLAVITQLQPISVIFPVPQDDVPRIRAQLNAGRTLSVDAFNRNFKTKLASGKLVAIDNQVDSSTGTVRLKAEFANTDNALIPNQFVNARLLVDTLRDVVLVPAAAVQRGPDSTFVYILQGEDSVAYQPVEVGDTEGDKVLITKGLKPGDIVVTDGVDKLQKEGSKVTTGKKKDGAKPDGSANQSGVASPATTTGSDAAPATGGKAAR